MSVKSTYFYLNKQYFSRKNHLPRKKRELILFLVIDSPTGKEADR